MKHLRRICLGVMTSLLTVGALGMIAPAAHADTGWPCATCLTVHR
jgi:hypothetical protein